MPDIPLATQLRTALRDLRKWHWNLANRSRVGKPRLPEADVARLWRLDAQVERLATQLGIRRPEARMLGTSLGEQGWTRIVYACTPEYGNRILNGSWDLDMDSLDAAAARLEAESASSAPSLPEQPVSVGPQSANPQREEAPSENTDTTPNPATTRVEGKRGTVNQRMVQPPGVTRRGANRGGGGGEVNGVTSRPRR
jgi:hypothetical protein